ncbi:hypothetical protein [Clostridium oryzae]|uniref:STAS/SEC14 domain-containing protein n=1 Tax=Clostridium oryzae TaxID=1450648 RepID=A0A1V4IXE4_9CLOT|nr:hypothetical protein [Clostridium oryzae]OPJ64434.1 hypothetical protein CLORY_06280 [Clostridium oryzae]
MMEIKDPQGLYEIKVDLERRIVYENHFKGLFTIEALQRMDKDYKEKVIPALGGKKWAKYCDMRNYQLSNIVDEMNTHLQYCIDHGLEHAALIVESAVVKMQMNRTGRNTPVPPNAFTDEKEADAWLKSVGH